MAKGGQPQKNAASSQMKTAWKLLDDGDVVLARREAKRVLGQPDSAKDADEAKALLERTAPAKEGFYFAALAAGVVVLLIVLAVIRT